MNEYQTKEETHREGRQRIINELETLRALSNSLTNENKALRDERIAIDERVVLLQNKVCI